MKLFLEFLGIPRLRVKGISVFNVLGTIAVAYLMVTYINGLKNIFDFFQMSCLLIVLGIVIHYIMNDYTPLVKLVLNYNIWKIYLMILLITGLFGWWIFKLITISYTLFLFLTM